MKRYKNTKTGAIIDSSFKISGKYWVLEDEVKVEEVEEIEEDIIEEEVEEVEEVELDSLTLEELKMYADDAGIKYASNIGRETLIAKLEEQGE